MDCHQFSSSGFSHNNLETKPVERVVSAPRIGIPDGDADFDLNQNSKGRERQFQLEVGSESPSKRVRNSVSLDFLSSNSSDAAGKALYPSYPMSYGTHTAWEFMEALPNLQKLLPSIKEECTGSSETLDSFHIPVAELTPNRRASWSKQPCLMFFKEGCQNGESCHFSHDECFRERESEAINVHLNTDDYSVYKTKMCSHWVESRRCRFGNKCHFAHGAADLRSSRRVAVKPRRAARAPVAADAPIASVSVPSQHARPQTHSSSKAKPKTGEIAIRKWKGPNKISKIYGDWIDDL